MPKVLIICGTFPPQSDVGGLRPAMMAKFLPEFGWEPLVLTRDYGDDHGLRDFRMHIDGLQNVRVMRVEVSAREEKEYLRARGFIWRARHFLEIEKTFPPAAYDKSWKFARAHLCDEKIDVIWATAPDFPPLRIGRDLSQKLGIPWIADFRDITEQEDGIRRHWRESLLRVRSRFRRSRLMRTSSFLTTVSQYHGRMLERKTGKACRLVYNGYDPELFKPVSPSQNRRFSIVYLGRILSERYRNPRLLFQALDALISLGAIDAGNIEIAFYATEPSILKPIIREYNSAQVCLLHDRLEHNKLPDIMAKASILLLLNEYGRSGVLSTKLFEYLAMERPILCIRTEQTSEMAEIIKKANAGYAGDDLEDVKRFLLVHYGMWKRQGYCLSNSDQTYISQFSRREQAGRLADLLTEAAAVRR